MMLKCAKCKNEVIKDWNYCPKCGNVLRLVRKLNIVIRKRNPVNPKLEVTEPKVNKLKNKIVIELPGIKNMKQVFLRKAGRTVELNAQTSNKRYFKILNVDCARIVDKMFADEKLILVINP